MQPPSTPSLTPPAAATAALFVPLAILDLRMMRTGGPGIIPFELAGPERSKRILHAWGRDGRRAARASLLLDFPFLAAYTLLNVRLMRRAQTALADRGRRRLSSIGGAVAVVQVAAGACDAIENTALLAVVERRDGTAPAALARQAALLKFAGLTTGWLYGALAAALGRR